MTTTPNGADEYADIIARELRALDTVLAGDPDDYGDDETPGDYQRAYNDALIELGRQPDDDPADVWADYLNETALDVSVRIDVRGKDHESTVEVLRTCGGPHAAFRRDTHDGHAVILTVHEGGDTATRRLYLSDLAAALDEWSDMMWAVRS